MTRSLALCLCVLAAAAALAASPASTTPKADPSSAPAAAATVHHGIDVSHHSGKVAWDQVHAQGYRFAYAKASEGLDAADPLFEDNWSALAELPIARGAYHFYVTEDDPIIQAEFFLSRVTLRSGDLPPVVDIETLGHGTKGDLVAPLRRFLEHVEKAVGRRPMIYTSAKFWNEHYDGSFGDYPLWVAEYEVDEPTLPNGWEHWSLWQFEGDAQVDGVPKGADRSRLHPDVSLESLRIP